jgi:hypothetical protein
VLQEWVDAALPFVAQAKAKLEKAEDKKRAAADCQNADEP